MKNFLYTEYGLELFECFIDELSKMEGLEKATALMRPPYKLIINEIKKEKVALLATESDIKKYDTSHGQLEVLLAESKKQIKEMLDTEKILTLLNEK